MVFTLTRLSRLCRRRRTEGVDPLTGAPILACDLRAGAAMVIAGLAAKGVTEIDGIHHIERGYETIVEKLANLGADIRVSGCPKLPR